MSSPTRSRSTWPSAVLNGEEPEVNDTETYDNGVKVVPSYLLELGHRRQGQHHRRSSSTRGYWTEEEIDG